MKRVLLYYHRCEGGNFGDDLNLWLWPRLLGSVLDGQCLRGQEYEEEVAADALLVGIGTILDRGMPQAPRKFVFGSGTGYGEAPIMDGRWTVYALRGPLTSASLGLPHPVPLGDAAYLLPLVMTAIPKGKEIGYVPHHSNVKNSVWREICEECGIRYINPTQPVEAVLKELLQCKLIIAEAMHGAILADVFRIPWVPVKTSGRILESKWHDWLGTTSLEYRPLDLPRLRPDRAKGIIRSCKQYIRRKRAVAMMQELAKQGDGQLTTDEEHSQIVSSLSEAFKNMKSELEHFKYR